MEQRLLGSSGIEVSPLGMGCWAIGGPWRLGTLEAGWGETHDPDSVRALHRALAEGINFFDTAANYGAGHSEILLGQALAGRRDQAVIATKFGFHVDEAAKLVSRHASNQRVIETVRADCEASLRRLNTDYIDLYQLHVWDYPVELVPPLLAELEALVAAGKIRCYGWSTDNVEGARLFAQGEHCAAIQHDLSVVQDAPAMLVLCAELGLASVNRSPLARGALTGKYNRETVFAPNDVRSESWSMETFFIPTYDKLDAIREVLTSGGRSLTQGALAWIWARSGLAVPIPGIRTEAQAAENAAAMHFGPLTPDQMAEIETLLGRAAETA